MEGTKDIFVNENLTYQRKKLFWLIKQIATGYKFYWTANGNIFTRKTEDSNAIAIRSENDVLLMK